MTDEQRLSITHYPAEAVQAMREDLIAVHLDARAELLNQPFYSADRFGERLEAYVTGPGFELVAGRLPGVMVGYAFGSTLPVDTRWWSGLEAVDAPDLTRETPGRTFAFREILVRKACQKRGYARQLHDALLANRREERATLLVRSDNPARELYLRWGWSRVGYVQPYPDSPRFEAMVLPL